MNNLEKASLFHLYALVGFGSKNMRRIKNYFGTFLTAWEAGKEDWLSVFKEQAMVEAIIEARKCINLSNSWERLSREPYDWVALDDADYPLLLKHIPQAPYVLFYRGSLDVLSKLTIGLVGSRRATIYGRKTACSLARELAEQQVVVASGMARGIDSQAHEGALEGKGPTVAVLGSGIDVVYPPENRGLYNRICEQGLVITEFFPGTPPEAGNFPRRNRIISGLSRGVAVVEAQMKSGALITVDFALEQGRDVFAVPGPITSEYSAGTNNLIKQGAKLITCAEDILEDYVQVKGTGNSLIKQPTLLILDNNEQEVLQYIGYEPAHMDDIVLLSGIEIGLVSTILLSLELAGVIHSLPGNYYSRA